MIVCGDFTEDFLTFPPTMVVDISSRSTKLRDRNSKYNLYELQDVKYYMIADTGKKLVEVFELINGKFLAKNDTRFQFTRGYIIELDVFSIW